jgi:hypothetical protein
MLLLLPRQHIEFNGSLPRAARLCLLRFKSESASQLDGGINVLLNETCEGV